MEETDHVDHSRSAADQDDLTILGAVHDANQLLSVILARVQLLREGAAGADGHRQLAAIEQAARDAAAIVAGVFARSPAADPGVTASARLADLVADCWDAVTVGVRAASRGAAACRLVTDIATDLTAAAPAYRLRQVIANLLANALEAMPDGGTVRVSGRRSGDRIHLAIEDEGPGLTEQQCADIFTVGYTWGKAQGHGIGLSHSRRLIEGAGGTLTARSQLGEGAAFLIDLPAATAPARAADPPAVLNSAARPGRSFNILAVEDEAPVRELLNDILANDGHRVTPAASGEEALALFVPGRFDLVLVDYALAGLTGLDVARAVKRADRRARVALMTGWGHERAQAAADPGLVDWWETKPLDLPKIRRLLAKIDQRRADRDA